MNSGDNKDNLITVAVCCYNAARYLTKLIENLAALECPIPFEILIIDNNSSDNTKEIVQNFASNFHIPTRYVFEKEQGIPFARNRAIEESAKSLFLAFIDADEIPGKKWLSTAVTGLSNYNADCVGGKILLNVQYSPKWLTDSIQPFLGKIDYGNKPFRITDKNKPVWTGNIAYRTSVFFNGLRFDTRYIRKGDGIGGGEDAILFREMLKQQYHIRYEPEMQITHLIPHSKLKRSYFLKLHYTTGKKSGMYETNIHQNLWFGIPRFMFLQLLQKTFRSAKLFIMLDIGYLREAMNTTYLIGLMVGLFIRNKGSKSNGS